MRYALVATLLIAAPAAMAQTGDAIPQIDVDGFCRKAASGFSDRPNTPAYIQVLKECVGEEQVAYDALKAVWPDLPADVRAACFSRRTNEAYQYLRARNCAYQYLSDRQDRADERPPIPRFRR